MARGVWQAIVNESYEESDITEQLSTHNIGERIDKSMKQKTELRNRFTQIHSDNWSLIKREKQTKGEMVVFSTNDAVTTEHLNAKKKNKKNWPYTFHKN